MPLICNAEVSRQLTRLSDVISVAHPRATVSWDTTQVTVMCGALWFGTSYVGWGPDEFKLFEEECLRVLEIYT